MQWRYTSRLSLSQECVIRWLDLKVKLKSSTLSECKSLEDPRAVNEVRSSSDFGCARDTVADNRLV